MRQRDGMPQEQGTATSPAARTITTLRHWVNYHLTQQMLRLSSGSYGAKPSHWKSKSLSVKSQGERKGEHSLFNGLGENLWRLKIYIFFLPVTTLSPLLFIEGDKSLRCKYFITIEWPCDLPYLTKDAYNSFKNRFWTQSRPLNRSNRSTKKWGGHGASQRK